MLIVVLAVGLAVGYVAGYSYGSAPVTSYKEKLNKTQYQLSSLEQEYLKLKSEHMKLYNLYVNLTREYMKTKTNVHYFVLDLNYTIDSLDRKLKLEGQFIKFMSLALREPENPELTSIFLSLDAYVEDVGRPELTLTWQQAKVYMANAQTDKVLEKISELLEINSKLIQEDIETLKSTINLFMEG